MILKKFFCPRAYVESVEDINLVCLEKAGKKGIIIDLDNTLVEWKGDISLMKVEIKDWLADAKRLGFKICLVSNGFNNRVNEAGTILGLPVVPSAVKPRRRPFLLAMERIGTDPSNTVVVGDQIFTDVLGGNRVGLYTILVKPISDREFFTTRLVRKLERMVVSYLERHGFTIF